MPDSSCRARDPYDAPMFPLRTVVLGAFVPSLIFEIGIGAMLPIIAPTAVGLGAGLALAGVLAALLPVGQILADLPAGALAARIGDRYAMILAGFVAVLAFAGAAFAPGLVTLGVAVLATGAASAVFNLARHSYLTEITPPLRRARVLSTLAGVHRIGQFLGPFVGALVIHGGDVRNAYLLGVATAAAATLTLVLVRETPPGERPAAGSLRARAAARRAARRAGGLGPRMGQVLREHRRVFTTLGTAVLLVGAVRGARQTVLPLWGEHLGLDPSTTSLIFGIAGAVDMLLFYPAGKVMDRLGRLWIGVPSMIVMGAAMIALPFTGSVASMSVAAAFMGLGNGMSSGILMTLGSDVAPKEGRAQFLGMWRVLQDSGGALGPLIASAGAALGSLAAGIWVTGALGGAAAGALARWVPRWSVHANRTTRRRAGLIS
ncbi:putative MFS family arabinose efflux permease [Georgenia soli]|uniref:Putative MFS family arabinose efflux permease n=1 Tax=Georgenia soli TaxID=638953 RepID=A0A2A9EJK7_9MICO|nr:MFS transporter [Georgenia soli]PFG39088.1 putative MFS family arabinose efflux permease [Georgenia soli]